MKSLTASFNMLKTKVKVKIKAKAQAQFDAKHKSKPQSEPQPQPQSDPKTYAKPDPPLPQYDCFPHITEEIMSYLDAESLLLIRRIAFQALHMKLARAAKVALFGHAAVTCWGVSPVTLGGSFPLGSSALQIAAPYNMGERCLEAVRLLDIYPGADVSNLSRMPSLLTVRHLPARDPAETPLAYAPDTLTPDQRIVFLRGDVEDIHETIERVPGAKRMVYSWNVQRPEDSHPWCLAMRSGLPPSRYWLVDGAKDVVIVFTADELNGNNIGDKSGGRNTPRDTSRLMPPPTPWDAFSLRLPQPDQRLYDSYRTVHDAQELMAWEQAMGPAIVADLVRAIAVFLLNSVESVTLVDVHLHARKHGRITSARMRRILAVELTSLLHSEYWNPMDGSWGEWEQSPTVDPSRVDTSSDTYDPEAVVGSMITGLMRIIDTITQRVRVLSREEYEGEVGKKQYALETTLPAGLRVDLL